MVSKTIPKFEAPPEWTFNSLLPELGPQFEELGDVIEMGGLPFPLFFFRHPDHIRHVYTDRETAITKPVFIIERVVELMGQGTFVSSGESQWGKRHGPVHAAFSFSRSPDFIGPLDDCMQSRFSEWDKRDAAVDIHQEIKNLVIDYAFRTLFSKTLNTRLTEVAEKTHFLVDCFLDKTPLEIPTPRNSQFRSTMLWFHQLMDQIIVEHQQSPEKYSDMVSYLLRLAETETAMKWSPRDVRDEMFSLYFGMSNLATQMSWVFYFLTTQPRVLESLEEEISEVLEQQPPTIDRLPEFRLPQMIFKETCRLLPAVWGYPRLAPNGTEFEGYRFPPGAVLFPLGFYAHRHPQFWTDPERFLPERFAPEDSTKLHRYAFYPFGGGPRMCLGRHLAPLIAQLVLISVVQRYSIASLNSSSEGIAKDFGFELTPRDGLPIKVQRKEFHQEKMVNA